MPLTPTARGTPTGVHLDDGFRTLLTFAAKPTLGVWEKEVKPVGYDGGDPIDTTTMFNTLVRTYAPRHLIKGKESTMKVAYDPDVLADILGLINSKTTITETYPDGTTLAYYGFLKDFERDAHKEGAQPEATLSIMPTFQDPVTGNEVLPLLTPAAGT